MAIVLDGETLAPGSPNPALGRVARLFRLFLRISDPAPGVAIEEADESVEMNAVYGENVDLDGPAVE